MKKLTLFLAFIFLFLTDSFSDPGDTIVVQTLTFSDITKRRGIWEFPDESHSYRKVLMYYTLKCDPATTADGYDCGEWDYLTYNFIYDHTGIIDSALLNHPSFSVNGSSPATYEYSVVPVYNYFQNWQYFPVYDDVISENTYSVGTGTLDLDHTFNSVLKTSRARYLFTAAELSAAGLSPGEINKLQMDISGLGSALDYLKINLKNSALAELTLTDFENTGFTTVYLQNTTFSSTGLFTFNFSEPFIWDGVSGILVEFTFSNSTTGTSTEIKGSSTGFNSGLFSVSEDEYLSFNGPDYVDVPVTPLADIDSFVTVSFWQFGDPAIQPQDDYCFEAMNTAGNRVLNVHLPWSNSNVYWDAGNATGYDRIYKAAATTDFEGKWNHWAFTKNVDEGTMKIYLNGVLWHSGTALYRDMDQISRFRIGSNVWGNTNYDGFINEFAVFDTVLDESTIASWMYKNIDPSHPAYSDLVAYYRFDEGSGLYADDNTGSGNDAMLFGLPDRKSLKGDELFRNLQVTSERPNIGFIQGEYNFHLDSLMFLDSVMVSPVTLMLFSDTTILPLATDTLLVWPAGYVYVYDHDTIADSLLVNPSVNLALDTMYYWGEPYDVINRYELGRFITPYGIGLDLGDNGFRWAYDVTDYAFLLHDSVDFAAGNNQELIDVKFLLIEGTPPRNLTRMDRIWGQMESYYYKDLDDDVVLKEKTIPVDPATESIKIKTRLTGHGHNSNTGSYPHCCEWKDNTHYLFINGAMVDSWKIFKYNECALNAVYPQGGTWPGAREGWCPGDVVQDTDFEVGDYISGDSIKVDYDITDVPAANLGMGWGNYVVTMDMFQFASPNYSLDAEVYDILTPTDWEYYSRNNPVCSDPKIIIRNNGSTELNGLNITYGVSGGTQLVFNWTGSLGFMETEQVELPVNSEEFWIGDENSIFTVTVSDPNGGTDEYDINDGYSTHFNAPDFYEDNFIILMRSNNLPDENYYNIYDINGNIVHSKTGLIANTTYYDTLHLEPGCYELELMDLGNDGLYYWAYPEQGTGYMRIKKIGGGILKYFEKEFGRSIHYAFTIGDVSNVNELSLQKTAEVYPNPTDGNVTLFLSGYKGKVTVLLYDALGNVITEGNYTVDEDFVREFNLNSCSKGLYYMKIVSDDSQIVKKISVN